MFEYTASGSADLP